MDKRTQVIIAVIGLTGVIGSALISSWDKIFAAKKDEPEISKYLIEIYTPVVEHAQTDEMIKMNLYGKKDHFLTILNDPNKNDFEAGNWDLFNVEVHKDLGKLDRIELIIEEGDGNPESMNGWYPGTVKITDLGKDKIYTVTFEEWLDKEDGKLRIERKVD